MNSDGDSRMNIVEISMEENVSGDGGRGGDGGSLAAGFKVAIADNGDEPTESREEGEISSDSDDCQEIGCVSQFADCNATTTQVESVQVAPLKKMVQDVKSDTCNPANKSSSMVDVSSSAYPQLDHHKGSEKNKGQFVPFVIRFSDDDSGSDSDDNRCNTSESKDNTQEADESRRPPPPSLQKSQKLQPNTVREAGVMPRQTSLGRPVISSKDKINGASTSAGQISSFRNLNYHKRRAGHAQQRRTNVHLNTVEMQDLRQLIEIRENQIRLKTTQQTKSSFAGFHNDNNARNMSNPVSGLHKTSKVHDLQSSVNNPSKKRLKTSEPHTRNLFLDCHDSVVDIISLEKSKSDDCGKQNVEGCCRFDKDNAQRISHASQLEEQKQNANTSSHPLIVEKEARCGPDIVANNNEIANLLVSPAQTGQIGKRHAGDFSLKPTSRDTSFLSCLDELSMNDSQKLNMTSMLEYEDLLDKELEEAQEHRRKCEIDEKNALTAYRKAQRTLVEANARCSYLYSKRELYSAQLRSLMMENPVRFFSTRPHDQTEAGLSVSNRIPDVNVHLMPIPSHHKQAASDINGRRDFDSKIPSDSAFQNQSHLHVEGQKLVSDPFIEPDESASETHKRDNVSDGVCCSSDDLSQSADEDDKICKLKPKSAQDNLECVQTSGCDAGREKDRNHGSQGRLSFESSEDSLLLEASLRSQLYEKLRTKRLFKKITSENNESVNERVGDDDGGKMTGMIAENAPFCEAEIGKHPDFESDNKEERFPELPVPFSCHSDIIPSDQSPPAVGDSKNRNVMLEGPQSTISVASLCPTMRSAFIHLKVTESVGTLQSLTTSSEILKGGENEICTKRQTIRLSEDTPEKTALNLCDGQSAYYSWNLAIDPFWPLCMFELRGKCNNDECPWQHVKDLSFGSMQHDAIDDTGSQVEKQLQREEFCSTSNLSKSLDHLVLSSPTYVVGSDVLRTSQSYTSLLAEDYGQCWQKSYSTFLVLSSLFARTSGSDEPFLHGTEARIEVHSDWDRQSSYFHSRNKRVVDQSFTDIDQSLEMALLNFTKEANKQKGRVEALKGLVPAIEANPRSAILWMVYLQIYYFNQKSIGRDDLFKWAVEFNRESFELWLLYINSREWLEDRLAAYDAALSALSSHTSVVDASCASQYILDIFLQMMDFMCRSGNVGNAIEKISGLIPSTKKADESCQLTLPNVISCLTICDKFIFWTSCVYLVLYKKLPHSVLNSFECWKESSIIEWPDVNLTCDEKQQATLLMETAVDCLVSYMDNESLENEKTIRAAHLFALNHVRCVAVLEGLVCSRDLLEKYIKLYPSGLELVLMAARAEYHTDGFEAALRNWPIEAPGVQCIWNQYAECALQSGKFDFVKDLMDRWFHSVIKAQDLHNEVLHSNGSDDSDTLLQSALASDLCAWFSGYNQTDRVFGMLNLSLYKILRYDHTDALFALNQALKAASADNFCHCLRELTMFLLTNGIQQHGEADVKNILSILSVHLPDIRAGVAAEPFSRGYIQKIGSPRARQLVSKMLSPISADFSLMNMVVEVWHGLLSLPQMSDNISKLVDFVEDMMEIMPSNYLLPISVCKLLIKSSTLKDSASICFWASSLLVNALFHAVPVAPEYVWVEAADVLFDLTHSYKIGKSFHKKALFVYPFSVKLWKSYLRIAEDAEFGDSVRLAAKEKRIVLNQESWV